MFRMFTSEEQGLKHGVPSLLSATQTKPSTPFSTKKISGKSAGGNRDLGCEEGVEQTWSGDSADEAREDGEINAENSYCAEDLNDSSDRSLMKTPSDEFNSRTDSHNSVRISDDQDISEGKPSSFDMPHYNIRRSIATKVIAKRVSKGYKLTEESCEFCEMPLMESKGTIECKVCPAIKKWVQKKKMRETEREREGHDVGGMDREAEMRDDVATDERDAEDIQERDDMCENVRSMEELMGENIIETSEIPVEDGDALTATKLETENDSHANGEFLECVQKVNVSDDHSEYAKTSDQFPEVLKVLNEEPTQTSKEPAKYTADAAQGYEEFPGCNETSAQADQVSEEIFEHTAETTSEYFAAESSAQVSEDISEYAEASAQVSKEIFAYNAEPSAQESEEFSKNDGASFSIRENKMRSQENLLNREEQWKMSFLTNTQSTESDMNSEEKQYIKDRAAQIIMAARNKEGWSYDDDSTMRSDSFSSEGKSLSKNVFKQYTEKKSYKDLVEERAEKAIHDAKIFLQSGGQVEESIMSPRSQLRSKQRAWLVKSGSAMRSWDAAIVIQSSLRRFLAQKLLSDLQSEMRSRVYRDLLGGRTDHLIDDTKNLTNKIEGVVLEDADDLGKTDEKVVARTECAVQQDVDIRNVIDFVNSKYGVGAKTPREGDAGHKPDPPLNEENYSIATPKRNPLAKVACKFDEAITKAMTNVHSLVTCHADSNALEGALELGKSQYKSASDDGAARCSTGQRKFEAESRRKMASVQIMYRTKLGWKLANASCPSCKMPLMTRPEGSKKLCVVCDEIEDNQIDYFSMETIGEQPQPSLNKKIGWVAVNRSCPHCSSQMMRNPADNIDHCLVCSATPAPVIPTHSHPPFNAMLMAGYPSVNAIHEHQRHGYPASLTPSYSMASTSFQPSVVANQFPEAQYLGNPDHMYSLIQQGFTLAATPSQYSMSSAYYGGPFAPSPQFHARTTAMSERPPLGLQMAKRDPPVIRMQQRSSQNELPVKKSPTDPNQKKNPLPPTPNAKKITKHDTRSAFEQMYGQEMKENTSGQANTCPQSNLSGMTALEEAKLRVGNARKQKHSLDHTVPQSSNNGTMGVAHANGNHGSRGNHFTFN